mmetsp:Transcript_16074/g.26241  ORF Transcript_16074/g.26241 Transcript_16074/m.26241 type:complete len:88 (+) Transcript_16074:999-1262(+)
MIQPGVYTKKTTTINKFPQANWVWNNQVHNTMTFGFDFATVCMRKLSRGLVIGEMNAGSTYTLDFDVIPKGILQSWSSLIHVGDHNA